jgi:predicted nucleic acid-binding protein
MSGKFFLDTNIFVYAFDKTAPAKARRSQELIEQAVTSRKGIISYQVAQEFFNVALRRFAHPLTVAESEQYLSTVLRPLMAVQSSPALLSDGLRLKGRYSLSWFDSLIVAAAIEARCDVLYSEDLQHGQKFSDVAIENPFLSPR